jgi:tetratricopeptide (TPR) repeat protein
MRDHPYVVEAYVELARALVAQSRNAEAAEVLAETGQGLLQSGEASAARAQLEEAVKLRPGFAPAHELLGRAYLREEAFRDAEAHLRNAIGFGQTGAVTFYLAAALWEQGRMDEVEELYRESIAEGDDTGTAHRQLGGLLLWQGRYAESVEALRRAVTRQGSSPDLILDLGRALEGAGHLEEARRLFEEAVRQAPEHAQARYALAMVMRRLGHSEAAQHEAAAFQRLHEEQQERNYQQASAQARLQHGWDLIRKRQWARAIEHFRKLPDTVEVLEGLAAALSLTGDYGGAVEALERALALAPHRHDLRLQLGAARLSAGGRR